MGLFMLAIDEQDALLTDWPDLLDHPWPSDKLLDEGCCPRSSLALQHYFSGESIDPATCSEARIPAGPPFYSRCWKACRGIGLGITTSYADLARRAGNPDAIRAAASSMRHNPLPIFVPCHRILESTGGLGGFAGSTDPSSRALQLKRELLEFESTIPSMTRLDMDEPALAEEGMSCA